MAQALTISANRRRPGRRPLVLGNAEDTRRAIFQHAMRLINERGYEAVSMSDIAHAAGLTKATLYYHFSSKADVLIAGALDLLRRVQRDIERVVNDRSLSVRQRLERLAIERQSRPLAAAYNAAMMDAAMRQLSEDQQAQLREAFARLHAPLLQLVKEGIATGELRAIDPEVIALAFRRLFTEWSSPSCDEDRTMLTRALLETFFHGVAGAQRA
ncbi:MAG: TetR family transcriptional regulator [Candidatus Roseilinea sp.]|nr:MAG: TetR family transcriptional regulator [Candidatus Roseilinea sp.]